MRAVTGIVHSLVYDSYRLSEENDTSSAIIPQGDDLSLYRISGAALCNMIKLRKDTLSEKEGKRKLTSA